MVEMQKCKKVIPVEKMRYYQIRIENKVGKKVTLVTHPVRN